MPSALKTLGTLSRFFKVPIGYFGEGEEAESIAGQVALLTLLRDAGVTGAALHSLAGLSEPSRQMIIEMIASAARMEGKQRGGEGTRHEYVNSRAPRAALKGFPCRMTYYFSYDGWGGSVD